jgi:hypothetical protein
MKMDVFWVVAACSPLYIDRRFRVSNSPPTACPIYGFQKYIFHIHPEDVISSVCQNVEYFSTFDAADTRKRKFFIEQQPRKPNDENSEQLMKPSPQRLCVS